jgi:hypothetical protein
MRNEYQVIVGNLGTVYAGHSKRAAMREFREYQALVTEPGDRISGEPVTLLRSNGEPIDSQVYQVEYTDTFSGEANYCWVQRATVSATSQAEAVRKAKAAVGLNGHRCKRNDFGDTLALYPRGMATVLFIN